MIPWLVRNPGKVPNGAEVSAGEYTFLTSISLLVRSLLTPWMYRVIFPRSSLCVDVSCRSGGQEARPPSNSSSFIMNIILPVELGESG